MAQAATRKSSGTGKRKAAEAGSDTLFPVVAIGASAGGLEPIGQFLEAMPAPAGVAIIVIQHLDPTSKSMLPELLAKRSSLKVSLAKDGAALEPNNVYVIPPGIFLTIAAGRLNFSPAQFGIGARMPIDVFLRSLAAECGRRGIGIIMSGTGTDGAEGLKVLKDAGGLALVQDPKEAQQDGMPSQAIRTTHPDDILPVREMPAVLLRYVGHHYVKSRPSTTAAQDRETARPGETEKLVEILKSAAGLDFSTFKSGTLQRRTERRMALHGITARPDYLVLLSENAAEAEALAKDMLISVTGFFRDPEAFAALAAAMPGLLAHHPSDQPLRIWSVGCSTGEEAYSLGILGFEQIAAAGLPLELQVFATDIDEESLQTGRAGLYPASIQSDISPDRLQRFFEPENGHFKVVSSLRRAILFSRHDALQDPPFSRLDIVSCRNVMIYLLPEAQRQLLTLLHFALREGGLLFLGAAETLGTLSGLFEPVNDKLRIYRRRADVRATRSGVPLLRRGPRLGGIIPPVHVAEPQGPSLHDLVQRTLLENYAPAAVVIDRQLAPLHFSGPTDDYLQVAAGEPGQDILSMVREGLRPKLRETIARAYRGKRAAISHGVWFKRDGRGALATIEARPLLAEREDLMLVSFIREPSQPHKAVPVRHEERAELASLREQLSEARRELSQTIRGLRQRNDELGNKNEEMMSLNEEFLSTNEELESSKEELQSLNEELTTVNAQLRQSLEQQHQTSTDLSNLLNSSSVGAIFLDSQLRIKIFNPRMQELFALIGADIGRPLADLLPKVADPTLLNDAMKVQSTGTPSEREIRAQTGIWYLRTATPYLLEAGKIGGVVVTYSDVSRLKVAEIAASAAQRYAEAVVDTISEPLVALDADLKVMSANAAFMEVFGLTAAEIAGRPLGEVASPLLALQGLIAPPAEASQPNNHTELELAQPAGGVRIWRATVRHFQLTSSDRPMVLLSLLDITEQKRIVRQQLQMLIDSLPGPLLAVDDRRHIRFVSKEIAPLFGYTAAELIGKPVDMLILPSMRESHARLHAEFVKNPIARPMAFGVDPHGVAKDGTMIPLDIGLSPVVTADGPLVIAAIHDRRQQERDKEILREAMAAVERASQAKSRFLAAASHDLRQPLQTIELLHGVLERSAPDENGRVALDRLSDAVSRMTEQLDSLLDINRLESGDIRPEITEVALGPLLARACDEHAPVAAAKGLQLRTVPSAATVRSDRRLLARLVGNLLSNAIKYTDSGKVLVGCRRRGVTLRIEVWDTGIGIPADQLDTIFEEFYRVDKANSSKPGMGLGLYIVQSLAQLLGHTIEVRSRPGHGTMFALVVALADVPPAQATPENQVAEKGPEPTILLIEDDPYQRDALRMLLQAEGYRVLTAATGAEALGQARGQAGGRPDVIISDYNLPGGMTGLDAIREIRREAGEQILAMVVTAERSAQLRNAIEAEGLRLVAKPVKTAELLSETDALVRIARPDWQGAVRLG